VTKEPLDLPGQPVNQVVPEPRVPLVLMDNKDQQVKPVSVVQRVSQAIKDLRETGEMMVNQGSPEGKDSQGLLVTQEMQGHLGPLERKDLKGPRVLLVIEGHQVHRELLGLSVKQAHQGHQDRPDLLALQE